jgi:predicted phosphodiesterase
VEVLGSNPSAPTKIPTFNGFKMTHIILADIHGNLEAFDAVVKSFPDVEKKRVICVGDVVGYGANPNECIDKIKSLDAANVKGNHEAAVLGEFDVSTFNPHAAKAVYWTRENLTRSGEDYIRGLPLVREDPLFTLVHGTLHNPEDFRYMMTNVDAAHTFEILKKKICFIGHSHVPAIFSLEGGKIRLTFKEKIKLKKTAKYIINVGSVGQPRDGEWRACYCIYDPDREEVELRRVEYDLKTAQEKIIDAGLPRVLAERLKFGR